MNYIVAAFLGLHGIAHLVGFLGTWGLMPATAGSATLPGMPFGLARGGAAAKTLGVLWLVGLAAFMLAAIALALDTSWWQTALVGAAAFSLVLSALWYQAAKIGLAIDVALLAGFALRTWVL